MRTNVKVSRPAPTTFEGTPAHRSTDVQLLYRAVASCLLWEDQFYESGDSIAGRVGTLTLAVSPEDAAAVARTARNVFKVRHAPLWIARILAMGTPESRAVVGDLLAEIIQRPDELTEFLSLYWKGTPPDGENSPISKQVKKGLAAAFRKFDAYQLAKYNRTGAVTLRDVLFLVHASPKDEEQANVWKQLVENTLEIPDTWETELSRGADKRATFSRLMDEGKLGALALLRNLRNMDEAGVPHTEIRRALSTMNVEKVLPFRFISAARAVPSLEDAIESAMFRCLDGHEKLAGRTALVVDTSPSMWQDKVSKKSDMDRFDAAAALAVLCREICDTVRVYAFNERAYEVAPRRGFALRDALAATKGQASAGGAAVQMANAHGYDRIIVLTDGQWHYTDANGNFDPWKVGDASVVSPPPISDKAYLINVASYANVVGSNKWTMIDGWSEGIVEYIRTVEMIESIETVAS